MNEKNVEVISFGQQGFNNMSSNILVIMSDNRDIVNDFHDCNYNTLTALINYRYCQKNNYAFKYFRPHDNGNFSVNNCYSVSGRLRHSAWAKLLSTMKAMLEYKEYDYIVYIDSDCIFNNFSATIPGHYKNLEIMNNGSIDKSNVLFANDKPWYPESPCSGYYILKNNDKSFAIFKEWYSIDTQESEYFNLNHCYEQWGVYRMFESKRKEELLMINDDMFLDSHAGQFLRHIATPQDRKRIPFFKGKIRELSLLKHFNELIDKLNAEVIEYDTNQAVVEYCGEQS